MWFPPTVQTFQSLEDGLLIEDDRLIDVREFWRWGITNFGAGCRVHWGWMEFADVCRVKIGRHCEVAAICTDEDLVGDGMLFLGGIAGGGPLVGCSDVWEWTLGGTWGSLSLVTSSVDMLEDFWRRADFAFDIDSATEFGILLGWGWTVVVVEGFFGCKLTICDLVWDVSLSTVVPMIGSGKKSEEKKYFH